MTKTARYAVVTPYYKEPRGMLERCIGSVRAQTVKTDHFLVSDGFAQDWLDDAGVNHLRLGHSHADCGDTPRGLGAMLAIAEHYEEIGFLDADNWFDEGHTEACVKAGEAPNVDMVIAKRRFVRYDESVMAIADEAGHADTSCFWLKEESFHLAHFWLMPVELAPICDRVFYAMIKARNLTLGHVPEPTVNFTCQYEALYRALGETPPPGAKTIDLRPIYEWLCALSERKRRLVALQCGVDMVPIASEALAKADGRVPARAARNEPCPCGSGKKYKHCHGAL